MRLLATLWILVLSLPLFANDSWNEVFGGSLQMMDSENESVQMKNETVRITMYNDYYEVDAKFYFYNHRDDITLKVGFPERAYGTIEGIVKPTSFLT